jgi:hypothetical protein
VRVQATLTVVVAALKDHRSVPISADLRSSRLERYLVPPPALIVLSSHVPAGHAGIRQSPRR